LKQVFMGGAFIGLDSMLLNALGQGSQDLYRCNSQGLIVVK